jgi:inhibitor of KinA sporulation pathway (predicted exonuclease)
VHTADKFPNPDYPTTLCRDITEFQQNVQEETDRLDTILHDLRRYFTTVKTKRQLGLNPAGFHRHSDLQKEFLLQTQPRRSKSSELSPRYQYLFFTWRYYYGLKYFNPYS